MAPSALLALSQNRLRQGDPDWSESALSRCLPIPAHHRRLPLSAISLMLSLRTMLDRNAWAAFEGRIGFVIGEQRFLRNRQGANCRSGGAR
jgi:hypothetical protein